MTASDVVPAPTVVISERALAARGAVLCELEQKLEQKHVREDVETRGEVSSMFMRMWVCG